MEKWEKLKIPLANIKEATQNFKNAIGTGGYGPVYEGKLLINGEYMKVAVKRSSGEHGQGLKEFLNEIDLLWDQKHKNIINLVGYCDEEDEKILVYEFAERGSLDIYFRFRNSSYSLTWLQRLQIVVDVARGLDHIHNHLQKKQIIIHRDIKASNILLDENWVAKISDFGLSRSTFSVVGKTYVVTHACGTRGYVEPELEQIFMANRSSDVYSFGMVLFEVLCGMLCNYKFQDKIFSAELAKEYYATGKLDEIVDRCFREQMSPEALSKFSAIAYKCLQDRANRPLMDVVKKELETLETEVLHSTPAPGMSKMREWNPLKISFQEILDATKNFTQVIDKREAATFYEGKLSVHGTYTKVMVKRSNLYDGTATQDFLAEIQLLSGEPHENIISLVGYCDEGKEKIIVYEYAKHGSLDQYIMCSNFNYTLTWLERLKIVVDVARGLDHVHNNLPKDLVKVHGDLKTSNVLLDDEWVAKIYGFRFSLKNSSYTCVSFESIDTYNYLDPHCDLRNMMTKESDVYSFGVVLFEVLCGKLCKFTYEDGKYFSTEVAQEYYANNELERIINPILREQMSLDSLRKYSAIAYECLQAGERRPLIDVVRKELERTLKIEVLRWGSFISRHWFILDVEYLSPKTGVVMRHEETKRLKGLAISCEEDDEYVELANKFQHYIKRSDKPLYYTNKKELYLRLCEGFLCDDGKLWFSLCESTNMTCSMLPAAQVLRDDIEYEHLCTQNLNESRFHMVKILGQASSYSFTCSLDSQMFSHQTMYVCYLVFKIEEHVYPIGQGLYTAEYGFGYGHLGKVLLHVNLFSNNNEKNKHRTDDPEPRTRGLDMKDDYLEYDLESWMHQRKDGWMEVRLSKPLNRLEDHSTLEVRLSVLDGMNSRIIVEGIEFRPYI